MASSLGPVQSVSTPEAVREKLLDWIAIRHAEGEDRLPPERALAQELQVSRTTLRQALRSLSDNGILAPRQGSGWYVRHDSSQVANGLAAHFRFQEMSLEQLLEARNIIEPPIAALAAERRTEGDLAGLEETHRGMLKVRRDLERFEVLDQQFHRTLALASQNPFFGLAVQPVLVLLREKRIGVLHGRGALEKSNQEHGAILAAVRNRKPEAARAAMTAHLSAFMGRVSNQKR